ncbi:MAG: nucleoside hydrolase [Rhodobacteraceae bacterium]|nr:nucleoside hydrolase [Paracoccaceae bacterium]
MPDARPVILDTDPGIDDAMAILFALADPEVELLALTTIFGNVPVGKATRNALQLVEMAGAETPVAQGAAAPLQREPAPHPDFVHGPEGFGDAQPPAPSRKPDTRDAAQLMIDMTAARPGEITIAAVGPLTNLALALDRDPAIAKNAGRVIVMGGAVRQRGNVTPHAEANIWQDPHAAARVFAADWPVALVGLDVTERVRCSREDLVPMAEASPSCGGFLAEAAEFYFSFHQRSQGFDGCFLHDPAALVAAVDMDGFQTIPAPLSVALEGEEIGRTRMAPEGDGPAVDICLAVDPDAVRQRWLAPLWSGRLP